MNREELKAEMLAYIETQDGEELDEWYSTPRDFAATVLSAFAEFLGEELVVPEYVPRMTRPQVDREDMHKALLRELLPEVQRLFNAAYDRYMEDK